MSSKKSNHSRRIKDKSYKNDILKNPSVGKDSVKSNCKTIDTSSSKNMNDNFTAKPCYIALERITVTDSFFCNKSFENSEKSNNKSELLITSKCVNQNKSSNSQIGDNVDEYSKELNKNLCENVKPCVVRLKRVISDKCVTDTNYPEDDCLRNRFDEDHDVSGSFISDNLLDTPSCSLYSDASREAVITDESDFQNSFRKKKECQKTVTSSIKQFDSNGIFDNQRLKSPQKRKAVLATSSSSESIPDREEILGKNSVRSPDNLKKTLTKRRNVPLKSSKYRHISSDSSDCNLTPDSTFIRKTKSVLSEQNRNFTDDTNADSKNNYVSKYRSFSKCDAENLSDSFKSSNNNIIERHENSGLTNLQTKDSNTKQLANKNKCILKSVANINKSLNKSLNKYYEDKMLKPCCVKLTKAINDELLSNVKSVVSNSQIYKLDERKSLSEDLISVNSSVPNSFDKSSKLHIKKDVGETNEDISKDNLLRKLDLIPSETLCSKGKNFTAPKNVEVSDHIFKNRTKRKSRKLSSSSSEPAADEEKISDCSSRNFSSKEKPRNTPTIRKFKKRRNVPPNRYPSRSAMHSNYNDSSCSELNCSDSSTLTADTKVNRGTKPVLKHNSKISDSKYKSSDISDSDYLPDNPKTKRELDNGNSKTLRSKGKNLIPSKNVETSDHILKNRTKRKSRKLSSSSSEVATDEEKISECSSRNSRSLKKTKNAPAVRNFKRRRNVCSSNSAMHSNYNDSSGSELNCRDSSQLTKADTKVNRETKPVLKHNKNINDSQYESSDEKLKHEPLNKNVFRKNVSTTPLTKPCHIVLNRININSNRSKIESSEIDCLVASDTNCLDDNIQNSHERKYLSESVLSISPVSSASFENVDSSKKKDDSDSSDFAIGATNSQIRKTIKKVGGHLSDREKCKTEQSAVIFNKESKRDVLESDNTMAENIHKEKTKSVLNSTKHLHRKEAKLLSNNSFSELDTDKKQFDQGVSGDIVHKKPFRIKNLVRTRNYTSQKTCFAESADDTSDATSSDTTVLNANVNSCKKINDLNKKSPAYDSNKDIIVDESRENSNKSIFCDKKLKSKRDTRRSMSVEVESLHLSDTEENFSDNELESKIGVTTTKTKRSATLLSKNLVNVNSNEEGRDDVKCDVKPCYVKLPQREKSDMLAESVDVRPSTHNSPPHDVCHPEFSDDSENFPDIAKTSTSKYLKKIFSGETNSESDDTTVQIDNCGALSDSDGDNSVEKKKQNCDTNDGDSTNNTRDSSKNKNRSEQSVVSTMADSDSDDAYLADTDDPNETDLKLANNDSANGVYGKLHFRMDLAKIDNIARDGLVMKTPYCCLGTRATNIRQNDNIFPFKSKTYGTKYIVERFKYDNIKKMFVIIRRSEEAKPKRENSPEGNDVSTVSKKLDSLGCFKKEDAKLFDKNPFLFSYTGEYQSQTRKSSRRKRRSFTPHIKSVLISSDSDTDEKVKKTESISVASHQTEHDSLPLGSTDLNDNDTEHSETENHCVHCFKKFANRRQNYHHRCSGKLKKGFLCRFCEKIFPSYSQLLSHKKLHSL